MKQQKHSFALALIFLFSGVSGLVYEIVWLRMLIRVFGVTIYAVSTVLVVFMGGLALGSFMSSRLFGKSANKLRTYSLIEIAIGLTSLLATVIIATGSHIFVAINQYFGASEIAVVCMRFLFSLIVLFPPTFLMGATLPLLSEHLTSQGGKIGKSVGMLYGINTLGAVFGVLFSGFILLYAIGEMGCVIASACLNFLVGALAWWLATKIQDAPGSMPKIEKMQHSPVVSRLLWIYAISGFCALAYQVLWSRILILVLGNSVYGFSAMLAVYLTGIALGSVFMSHYCDRLEHPLKTFGYLELSISIFSLISIVTFQILGASETRAYYLYSTIWGIEDFASLPFKSFLIVFPTTFLLGMLFPLLAKACLKSFKTTSSMVGKVYGYNTIGSIFGSFLAGFFLIPFIGTFGSFLLVAAISFILGIYLFLLSNTYEKPMSKKALLVPITVSLLIFGSIQIFIKEDPFLKVFQARLPKNAQILDHREDKAAAVTAVKMHFANTSARYIFINGLLVSGTGNTGRWMVHIPLLFHPNPKKSLLIGFGTGESFRCSLEHNVDTTIAELVESVVKSFPLIADNADIYLKHPKAHIVLNDGRNHLLQTKEKYDFVLVDVSPPIFASGMVNLYSLEFVTLVKEHLTEDGIFNIWVPIPAFESDFWMIARNFCKVFPHVSIIANPKAPGVYMLGTTSKKKLFEVSQETLLKRLVARKIPNLSPQVTISAKNFQIMQEQQIRNYAKKYPLVTDNYPYTEFPLIRFWNKEKFYQKNIFLQKAMGKK